MKKNSYKALIYMVLGLFALRSIPVRAASAASQEVRPMSDVFSE